MSMVGCSTMQAAYPAKKRYSVKPAILGIEMYPATVNQTAAIYIFDRVSVKIRG